MTHGISVVTCSETGTCPILEQSLDLSMTPPWFVEEIVCERETESITKAFNRGAKRAKGDVLIFTHDDVESFTSHRLLWDAARLACRKTVGVIGAAGAYRLDGTGIWWNGDGLSGACLHKDNKKVWMSAFGPYCRVVVLDGVFLMICRESFETLGGFDESLPGFDFYDVDLTLRAHLAGFKNYTFPFHLLHHSVGETQGRTGWHNNRDLFLKKFEGYLPVEVEPSQVPEE
jgi:GT2 family glycosyltransferase